LPLISSLQIYLSRCLAPFDKLLTVLPDLLPEYSGSFFNQAVAGLPLLALHHLRLDQAIFFCPIPLLGFARFPLIARFDAAGFSAQEIPYAAESFAEPSLSFEHFALLALLDLFQSLRALRALALDHLTALVGSFLFALLFSRAQLRLELIHLARHDLRNRRAGFIERG
jgi:hypothetical protein